MRHLDYMRVADCILLEKLRREGRAVASRIARSVTWSA